MKKILSKIIVWVLLLVLTITEWMFMVLVKISTVVVGLFFNVLLICMIIAVGTKEWKSLGILIFVATIGMLFVYGKAALLYFVSEAKADVNKLRMGQ